MTGRAGQLYLACAVPPGAIGRTLRVPARIHQKGRAIDKRVHLDRVPLGLEGTVEDDSQCFEDMPRSVFDAGQGPLKPDQGVNRLNSNPHEF